MGQLLRPERLRGVHFKLVLLAHGFMKSLPFDCLVSSGVRTNEEQAFLYAQGRNRPGKVVTNAPTASTTAHGRRWVDGKAYGMAMDIWPTDKHGQPLWDDWDKMRQMASLVTEGVVEWGGDWKSFPDGSHFEVVGWRTYPPAPDDAPFPNGDRA